MGSVLVDPLGRRLRADLVDPGQVVAGLAHERRDVRVLLRRHAVLLHHLLGVVPTQLAHAHGVRVEQRDVVVHELDGVPVAGDHEDPEALLRALLGQGREDVVRLVVLLGDGGDVHGLQRLLEERDLTGELGRRRAAGALVLRVLAGAEREARDVERHRDVGRLLLLQQEQQHGEEAVDGVGVLAVAGGEAVDGERVERPECQRVAVDDQKGRLFGIRHGLQPISSR
jgi:hypothetical protein